MAITELLTTVIQTVADNISSLDFYFLDTSHSVVSADLHGSLCGPGVE